MKQVIMIMLAMPCLAAFAQDNRGLQDLQQMQGFKTLLTRGKIPSIRKPEFVSASEAKLPDDAWIIGVTDGTHAKAYSINLLNRHEIVNDFIGDKPIATTW